MVKRRTSRAALSGMACAVAFLIASGVQAAEPKGKGKGKAAAKAPEAPAAEPGKKLMEEKPFAFEPRDRRDPFSFLKKVDVPIDPGVRPDGTSPPPPVIDPLVIQQKKAEAEAHYATAEKAFLDIGKEGKPLEVMAKCDLGLKIFTDLPALSTVRDLQEIRERLVDMRKAAERMKTRHEAEKRFREVHLKVTGVVARERRSTAIVNGRTVFKGDVLAAADNYSVVIEDIQVDRVVFLTPEGFKTMQSLSEIAK
jgi:hypothetical protein